MAKDDRNLTIAADSIPALTGKHPTGLISPACRVLRRAEIFRRQRPNQMRTALGQQAPCCPTTGLAMKSFNQRYDLVVIGAGICGLAAAYLYQQQFPDHTVLIVDRTGDEFPTNYKKIGSGLTGRSGGHLMPGFEADHSTICELIGAEHADKLYLETLNTIKLIAGIVEDERISCGFHYGHWIVDSDDEKLSRIGEFMLPRRTLGLPEPQYYSGSALKQRININNLDVGYYFPDMASFISNQFVRGLTHAISRRGGHIAQGVEYITHNPINSKSLGKPQYRVKFASGETVDARQIVLAGGDALSRQIPQLHARTFTIYTGRVGVHLNQRDFGFVSPQRVALAGFDTELKCGRNPLEGDFTWFSIQENGYLAMGFGSCIAASTKEETQTRIDQMAHTVREKLYHGLPFLKDRHYRVNCIIGGLNTTSNLLPYVHELADGVYALGGLSGVGLNQSFVLARALTRHMGGDSALYVMFQRFRRNQALIPTMPKIRNVALKLGTQAYAAYPTVTSALVSGYAKLCHAVID